MKKRKRVVRAGNLVWATICTPPAPNDPEPVSYTHLERLRAARIEQGFTQEELAKAIGVTKSTMAKYDRGDLEPNISNIMKLSQVLCVSVDYLLFGEDPLENELRACVEMLE